MLSEGQTEKVKMCNDCAGFMTIETQSDRVARSLCVYIPRHACTKCRMEGLDAFAMAKEKRKYSYVRLLDLNTEEAQLKA